MKRPKSQGRKSTAEDEAPKRQAAPPIFLPPLKPRPLLLAALAIVLLIWVGTLLALYFTTVYPYRHPQEPPAPSPIPARAGTQTAHGRGSTRIALLTVAG